MKTSNLAFFSKYNPSVFIDEQELQQLFRLLCPMIKFLSNFYLIILNNNPGHYESTVGLWENKDDPAFTDVKTAREAPSVLTWILTFKVLTSETNHSLVTSSLPSVPNLFF